MIISTSKLGTEHSLGYLRQLSNHFSKWVSVAMDEHVVRLTLPIGTCDLTASQTAISAQAQARADHIDRMEELFGGGVERCAFRENANLSWHRAMPPYGD